MKTRTIFFKSIIPLLACALFWTCTTETQREITEYQPIRLLEPEKVVEVPNTGYTFSFIVDSLLIFSPLFDTLYFHVYHKDNLELLFKFGKEGRAHHEFTFPLPFNYVEGSDNHSVFSVYDINLYQIKHIDFGAIAKGANISDAIVAEPMPLELTSTHELNTLSNGNIIGLPVPSGQKAEGLFFIFDPETKKKKWVPIPNRFTMEEGVEQAVYRGNLYSNSEYIFFASSYFDQVFFYNSQGELLKEWYFSEIKMPLLADDFDYIDKHKSPDFFRYIFGNSKSCFIVRVGAPLTEWEKADMPLQLFEFDWTGDLKNVYEIHSNLKGLYVDENSNTLYCVLRNIEELEISSIAKFHLFELD